jgi:transposase-like protein
MAGRRSPETEIREIPRRLQLGEHARRIARDLGVSRNTVAHYRRWAAKHGLGGRPQDDCTSGARGDATPFLRRSRGGRDPRSRASPPGTLADQRTRSPARAPQTGRVGVPATPC